MVILGGVAVVAVGAEDLPDNRTPRSAATGLRSCLRVRRELSMPERERKILKKRRRLRKLGRTSRRRRRERERRKKAMTETKMTDLRVRRRHRAVQV